MERTNIMVEFSIIGDIFPENVVTEKLSLKPSGYYVKGEKIKNLTSQRRKETCWFLSSGYEESLDINEQLEKIIDMIKNKVSDLKELKEMFELEYKFFIVINIKQNQTPAVYLSSNFIKFAYDIEAEFDFDLYIS